MKHCHLLEVLGVLVLDDVDDVVYRDYADESRLVVNSQDGEQVVFSRYVCDFLLVVERVDADELGVGVHYVADKLVVFAISSVCRATVPIRWRLSSMQKQV